MIELKTEYINLNTYAYSQRGKRDSLPTAFNGKKQERYVATGKILRELDRSVDKTS